MLTLLHRHIAQLNENYAFLTRKKNKCPLYESHIDKKYCYWSKLNVVPTNKKVF